MGFKLPKAQTIMRNVLMTGISLIVLRMIGGFFPKVQSVPVIGAVFR